MKYILLYVLLPVLSSAQDCSKIQKVVDDFTGAVEYNTPMIKPKSSRTYSAILFRNINNGKPIYALRLEASGSTPNLNKAGAIIMFSDSTKWEKPNASIDVEVGKDGRYEYSTYITLTDEELAMLASKPLWKFRLYIYDRQLLPDEANDFMTNVQCLRAIKD